MYHSPGPRFIFHTQKQHPNFEHSEKQRKTQSLDLKHVEVKRKRKNMSNFDSGNLGVSLNKTPGSQVPAANPRH